MAGRDELRALGADLKRAGGGIREKTAKAVREPTKGIYDTIRRAILDADLSARRVGEPRFTSLRASKGVHRPTASALSWKVSTSSDGARAELNFNPAKMPPRIRALFAYWVGQKVRLRHPVMGHRKGRWVSQRIPNVWATADDLIPRARRNVAAAMDETAATIAGRGRR